MRKQLNKVVRDNRKIKNAMDLIGSELKEGFHCVGDVVFIENEKKFNMAAKSVNAKIEECLTIFNGKTIKKIYFVYKKTEFILGEAGFNIC